ncbi:MAG: baseplate J/gp47 family protein [Clostridiales bacterium]|nr:baseplate J/gp47 family protein [Clostridiales bacterium]
MYENITYESILERMLNRVPDEMDKREGSIIYDALAPAAVELQLMYIELDVILRDTFASTTMDRDFMVLRASERGIEAGTASAALVKGKMEPISVTVPVGSRFSCGILNYYVKEKIADGEYQLLCESSGSEANSNMGQLIPIGYIAGLETAEITELLIPGEDEEGLESIREKYLSSFDAEAFGGNKADYIRKCDEIQGVGPVRVTAAWNGGGTVKLTILDSEYQAASETLIEQVQEAFDPNGDGLGDGLAPIGHVVTVETAETVEVQLSASCTYKEGYDFGTLESSLRKVVDEYLDELRKEWGSVVPIVRISQVESRILSVEGVLDITETKINGKAENLKLTQYQIPKLGGMACD